MKKIIAALLCALAFPVQASEFVITSDPGGAINDFIDRYNAIRLSGGSVKIDGMCLSACALVTMLPREKICVTPAAVLGFHSAYTGHGSFSSQSTGVMWFLYPRAVRELIKAKGWDGLSEHTDFVFVEHDELRRLYRDCGE